MPIQPNALTLDLPETTEIEECDLGELSSSTSLTGTPSTSFPPSLNSSRQPSPMSPSPSLSTDVSPCVAVRSPPLSAATVTRSRTITRSFDGCKPRYSGLSNLELSTEMLVKMQRWIVGFAIVEFDLDTGPVVQGTCPPLALSPSESENIAFSSLPDSVQFDQGSQAHSFRVRDGDTCKLIRPKTNAGHSDGFIYGFSYFTQKTDATSKRGYRQRSVVILTYYQYPSLFSKLSFILGPLYELHGLAMLETACHNIANWRDPVPGVTVELGFLGSVLEVELPLTPDTQQLTETQSFDEKYNPELHILASSPPLTPPPLLLFEACLPNLWSIWECLVLCEPILVFSLSPAATSQAIWWFRDLLRPIPLVHDIRPYFTIHDRDHGVLVNKLSPKAGLLLGVTNPFIERSCKHWPHVLSLGPRSQTQGPLKSRQVVTITGPPPGWKTKVHKRHTSKDRPLLKRLEDACELDQRAKMEASLILRRHFCSRTMAFLVPLHRYLNTLIPPPSELVPQTPNGSSVSNSGHSTPRLKPFSPAGFFASLKAHGSPLPFRSAGAQKEFYARWLRTPAFGLWLTRQEEIVQGVLKGNANSIVS